jgi:hypothetical protein
MTIKKMNLLLLVFVSFFTSCINQENAANQNQDTLISNENLVQTEISLPNNNDSLNRKDITKVEDLLHGIWALGKEENAEIIIRGKYMQFFEDDNLYEYSIENNMLAYMEDGDTIATYKVIKLSKDSLIVQTMDSSIKRLVKKGNVP